MVRAITKNVLISELETEFTGDVVGAVGLREKIASGVTLRTEG
jgi:hypothetical protein